MVSRIHELLEEIARAEANGADAGETLESACRGEVVREIVACENRLQRLRALCPDGDFATLSSHVKKAAALLGIHQRTAPWRGQWE